MYVNFWPRPYVSHTYAFRGDVQISDNISHNDNIAIVLLRSFAFA